jgi:hypothetical protein
MRLFLEQKFRLSNKLSDTTVLCKSSNKFERSDLRDDKVGCVNIIVATGAKATGATLQKAERPIAESPVNTRKYLYSESLPTIIHEHYCKAKAK